MGEAALSPLQSFTYSPTGDLLATHTYTNSFDILTETYAYDMLGNRIATTGAHGNTTYRSYDPLGNLTAEWGATYPVRYTYDAHGRRTSLSTVALQYRNGRFEVKGNLLATLVGEDASDIARTIHYNKVSPYAGVSVRPLKGSALRLRYFYKETYRVPNFNEMYYFVIPYDTLRPECAHQHNVGLTLPVVTRYGRDSLSHRTYTFTLDGYHNSVTDKIIAIPRQSMFYWSTMNLGRVDITGLDVSGIFEWQGQRTSLSATLTYSLQHAVNHTDPNDPKSYGHQIPYTPRHSGSLTLYGQTPYINLGLSCMVVGDRYYKQQNKEGTRLPPYADLGLTLDRTFALSLGDLRVQVQVLNLLDVQYEVVRSYPMMGRNFRLKLSYTF